MNIIEFLEECIAGDVEKAKYGDAHLRDCERFTLGFPCTCKMEECMLAECEFKQTLIEIHRPWAGEKFSWTAETGQTKESQDYCSCCMESRDDGYDYVPVEAPCSTLRALVTLYSGQPGCQEEWK